MWGKCLVSQLRLALQTYVPIPFQCQSAEIQTSSRAGVHAVSIEQCSAQSGIAPTIAHVYNDAIHALFQNRSCNR